MRGNYKVVHQARSITLSILNGFSKLFYWKALWKICDKTVIKDPITPERRCNTESTKSNRCKLNCKVSYRNYTMFTSIQKHLWTHHHHVACPLQERCRFHDFTPQFTVIMCAGQTTDPGSVVWGRSLLYAATFVEDDREVVSSPSAGRRCQRWGPVCGPHCLRLQ